MEEQKEEYQIIYKEFGATVRRIRTAKNLSTTKMSRLVGMESSNYVNLELEGSNATLRTIIRVCKAFDIKVSELFIELERGKKKD